jgi:hypothetical protein
MRPEGLATLLGMSRARVAVLQVVSSRLSASAAAEYGFSRRHLRVQLTVNGLDAGPVTIAWHLEREGFRVLSTSTIRRILDQAGLIVPEPRKRPRSS